MNLNMKLYRHLLIAFTLLILPACEQKSNGNKQNEKTQSTVLEPQLTGIISVSGQSVG